MSQKVSVGNLSDIAEGDGREYLIDGQRIAVWRRKDGSVHATQADCIHAGGRLVDGLLGSSGILCPLHGWKFDLATGRCLQYRGCGLTTYAVEVTEAGEIWVDPAPREYVMAAE